MHNYLKQEQSADRGNLFDIPQGSLEGLLHLVGQVHVPDAASWHSHLVARPVHGKELVLGRHVLGQPRAEDAGGDRRPGPRRVGEAVASAAQEQGGKVAVQDEANAGGKAGGGHVEAADGVAGDAVGAALHHDDIWVIPA